MLSSRKPKSPINRESRLGAAAVEMAFVAPLFLLLLAGIIEFGQAFRVQHALSSAARMGARSAILTGSTNGSITNKVQNSCATALGIDPADVSVVIGVNGSTGSGLAQAKTGDQVSVTINVPYSKAAVGFFSNRFKSSSLTATCSFEHE